MPYEGHNGRSTGGHEVKFTRLDFWVSYHRFFVSRSPYLALEYQSDVTKGVNLQLEVKIGGELEAKHLNLLY